MDMELRHLRAFVQLADDLHFARAARNLGISQPPLSQQIKLLEEELGLRLFDRTSRRVSLTPAGRIFLAAAQQTLDEAARAVALARRAARGEIGSLRIGFSASAPFVPGVGRALRAFRDAFPEVDLAMSEMAPPEQIKAIEAGALDIGFLRSSARPAAPATLRASLLQRERLVAAMAADHPLASREAVRLADLGGQAMLVYASDRGGGFTDELFGMMRAAGAEPAVRQVVREVSTMLGLTAAGLGITVLVESLCALSIADLVYRPLADTRATASMWLVEPARTASLPAANFLALLRRDGAAA